MIEREGYSAVLSTVTIKHIACALKTICDLNVFHMTIKCFFKAGPSSKLRYTVMNEIRPYDECLYERGKRPLEFPISPPKQIVSIVFVLTDDRAGFS